MNSKVKYLLAAVFVVIVFLTIDKKSKEKKEGSQNSKQDVKTGDGQTSSSGEKNLDSPTSTSGVDTPTTGVNSQATSGDVNSPGTSGKAKLSDNTSNPEVNLKLDEQQKTGAGNSNQAGKTQATDDSANRGSTQSTPQDKTTAAKQDPKQDGAKVDSKPVKEEVKVPEKKIFQASPGEGTCDEQWQKYTAGLVQGSELVYMTNLAVQKPLAPEINTQHLETIKTSSSGQVARDLLFVSDHPTGVLVLSNLDLTSQIKYSKHNFLNFCTLGQGRAAGLAMFNVSALDVIDVTDATIEVGAGTFAAFKFNLGAQIQVGKKSTKAAAIVWVSRKKPGLVLKQTVKISSKTFPDHGAITFTSQLAGTKGVKF